MQALSLKQFFLLKVIFATIQGKLRTMKYDKNASIAHKKEGNMQRLETVGFKSVIHKTEIIPLLTK